MDFTMIDLYNYSDYRDYLHDFYEDKKHSNANYSYRFIAMKIGFKSSFLSRLFKKETHLALDKVAAYADLMKLTGKDQEYFDLLVRFGRAKSEDEREKISIQLERVKGITFTRIQRDEESFFSKCHHMTMRSLLGIHEFTDSDMRKIASMMIPVLTIDEARSSVELLQRLGMVIKNENGVYIVTDTYISTNEKWSTKAIHEYQLHNINLSQTALNTLPKNERDISTVTFTINRSRMDELREKLQTFREDMFRFSEEGTDDDAVMHLNLQLFPTAQIH